MIGRLHGETADGTPAMVHVYKSGRNYRIAYGLERHLCHPSVRGIETVKREAMHVFGIKNATFDEI
jgi:hypothetical protein